MEEFKLFIQKYSDSETTLVVFDNKKDALNMYLKINDENFHTYIEYWVDGRFKHNLCGTCLQKFIREKQ